MINRISRYSVDVLGLSVPYEIHHVETTNSFNSVNPWPYHLDETAPKYNKVSYELRLKELSADQLNAVIRAIETPAKTRNGDATKASETMAAEQVEISTWK